MTTQTEKNTSHENATATTPERGGARPARQDQRRGERTGGHKKNVRRKDRTPRERVKPEFDQEILGIRRVTRVMAGGRRFSFSVTIVAGDRRGRVGVGVGKAGDTALAIEKALRAARKAMISIPLTDNKSIKKPVDAKYCASIIEIRPSPGRGLVAGGAVRTVLELAGITDITSKIHSRSKNSINNSRAALKALGQLTNTT